MACATPSILCAICETLAADQKIKPGVLLCIGCQKQFCSQHIVQHRQYLTDLFDKEVVNERNELQEKVSKLYDYQWSTNIEMQLETINKWEFDTTQLIKQLAECARKQIQEKSLIECDNLKKQFAVLSEEIITLRENENYFEKDIEQLTNKLQLLKHDVEHFPIELSINEIPQELIVVKSMTKPASLCTPPSYFVDQLLISQKPKKSINISTIKPAGGMYPISDRLIAFFSKREFPALNIGNGSWRCLKMLEDADELHWFDHSKEFLVLKYTSRNNGHNQLYQFNPCSGDCEEIWERSLDSNSVCHDPITTLTCFKEHVLIVFQNRIEKWSTTYSEWYTSEEPSAVWRPPISCQSRDKIKCIRMNDRYYALIISKEGNCRSRDFASGFYFELRNRGMSPLHHIITNYHGPLQKMQFFSLPDESGWLYFSRGAEGTYCYVIDNDGKRYEQNTVLSSNVTDIAVRNNLILIRRKVQSRDDDVLEIYEWKK